MADYDVLVIGGGPVGAALALALREAALAVGLLEARRSRAARSDPRPIALSYGSRLILERLGIWESLQPLTPIMRIHVSQRGGFGRVELDAAEARLPALGYVVDYARLAETLAHGLERAPCDYLSGVTVSGVSAEGDVASVECKRDESIRRATARLVAVADGGALADATRVRTRDYRQAAVTARVSSSVPHRNVAYERFTPEGPLALLPSGDALALIWTMTPGHAQALCAVPESEFLQRLQAAFGGRLGRLSGVGGRAWFPLALRIASRAGAPRVVAVGNAAQTLHPVAGQGLNLGLRDAWELAAAIEGCEREKIGGAAMLDSYRARRQLDRGGGIWFTDMLARLFSNDIAPLRFVRGLALEALGAAPPAKDFVVRRMTFGARG